MSEPLVSRGAAAPLIPLVVVRHQRTRGGLVLLQPRKRRLWLTGADQAALLRLLPMRFGAWQQAAGGVTQLGGVALSFTAGHTGAVVQLVARKRRLWLSAAELAMLEASLRHGGRQKNEPPPLVLLAPRAERLGLCARRAAQPGRRGRSRRAGQ